MIAITRTEKLAHERAGKPQAADPYAGRVYQVYRGLLERMLHNRTFVLLLAGGMLAGGLLLASTLVRGFFGPSDRNQFLVYVDLPAGYRIQATDGMVERLTTWLADKQENPEVASSIAYIGTGGPRFFLSLASLGLWHSIGKIATYALNHVWRLVP